MSYFFKTTSKFISFLPFFSKIDLFKKGVQMWGTKSWFDLDPFSYWFFSFEIHWRFVGAPFLDLEFKTIGHNRNKTESNYRSFFDNETIKREIQASDPVYTAANVSEERISELKSWTKNMITVYLFFLIILSLWLIDQFLPYK